MTMGKGHPREKRRKPKHLEKRCKKGITGMLFPDLYAKHMALDK